MALPKFNIEEEDKKTTGGLPAFDSVMPPIDDDIEDDSDFEEMDMYDVVDEDDEDDYDDNYEIYEEVDELEASELPTMGEDDDDDNYWQTEDDYNPDYEDDLADDGNGKYVDKKKKKIIPLGGKRSKRKIKADEFDNRRNTLAKTRIIRAVVLLILLIMFGLGIKNTFFPSHVYSDQQIKDFARQGAGQTLFPKERGEAFVESFMEVYLTAAKDDDILQSALSHYYGENEYSRVGSDSLRYDKGSRKQVIAISPKVYETTLLTDYSAAFKVNAFVANEDEDGVVDSNTARWLSFAINVYYDESLNSMIITKDSPTLIPTYSINKQRELPKEAKLGNGSVNSELLPAVAPTINGYISAYANTSKDSYEEILQYVYDRDDTELYSGFGGAVRLKDNVNNSIKKVIYNSDDGYYRADVEVNWVDKAASTEDNIVEYNARYIMRIADMGGGKYLVVSFKPYNFFKSVE